MAKSILLASCLLLAGVGMYAQAPTQTPASPPPPPPSAQEDSAATKQEIEQLKRMLAALEKRLEAQEKQQQA
jgi:hypothetical protein